MSQMNIPRQKGEEGTPRRKPPTSERNRIKWQMNTSRNQRENEQREENLRPARGTEQNVADEHRTQST